MPRAIPQGVNWKYDAATHTSTPGDLTALERTATALRDDIRKMPATMPERATAEARLRALDTAIADARKSAAASPVRSVRIVHRHHFSSKLQRMSVIARVEMAAAAGTSSSGSGVGMWSGTYCLVKGSPEALQPLLAPGSTPSWFSGESWMHTSVTVGTPL
jgi:cation-transporting ATPase 13A1